MDCHLVTVKVGIVCSTYQRMQFDCTPFRQDRLKSLDTKPMQSRCTVQKHRMFFDYIFQNIPNSSSSTFYHAFCTFDISSLTAVNQAFHDKRLKQFQRHFFRQTTLMHFQFRPYYNNRTTGIVNTFT